MGQVWSSVQEFLSLVIFKGNQEGISETRNGTGGDIRRPTVDPNSW